MFFFGGYRLLHAGATCYLYIGDIQLRQLHRLLLYCAFLTARMASVCKNRVT